MVRFDRLTALEAGFLELETAAQPLHLGSLLVFEGPAPDHAGLRDHLASRLETLPFLRRRVLRMPGDLGRPVWVDAERFDLHQHLSQVVVAAPGDEAQVRRLVARLMEPRLSPDRPPWAMWQVDGLAGGRWALVVKAHHVVTDGTSGVDLVRAVLSGDPDAPAPPSADTSAHPVPSRVVLAVAGLSWVVTLPLRALRLLARALLSPRAALRRVGRVRAGLAQVIRPDLPPCELSGPLGARRGWGWVSLDLADVRTVTEAVGCTVNDAFLGVLTGAYRTYLSARGDPLDRLVLRAIVPVSRRGPGTPRGGNRVSAMFVELPVTVDDAARRLAVVSARTRQQKAHDVAASTEAVVRLADHVPAPVLVRAARAYARAGQRRVNVAATNVPGPPDTQFLLGRRLLEIVPFVPLALLVRTSHGMVSYAGRLTIGVTGDAAALPDLDRLVDAVRTSADELVAGRRGADPGRPGPPG